MYIETGSVLGPADYRAFIVLEDFSLEGECTDKQAVIKQCESDGVGVSDGGRGSADGARSLRGADSQAKL